MAAFSAVGVTLPPIIVYPLQKISREISGNLNETWGIGRSKRGSMTGALKILNYQSLLMAISVMSHTMFPSFVTKMEFCSLHCIQMPLSFCHLLTCQYSDH
ncbi:hypothetical protein PR048_017676 [Dryococelus australis]|uniref:Uncharacterized protein n=1 Tax=Dryococelus australis TaxID=614101 RepID=A0ABQ9HA56_9NEOP|nr:hypothetical protein PR048_017676 [Dryococelus australis]